MKLRYDTTPEDLRIFNRLLRKRSHTARLMKRLSTGVPAMLLLVLVLSTASWEEPALLLLWTALLPGSYLVFFPLVYEWLSDWQAARLYKEGNQKGVLGPHELEVLETGLEGTTEVSSGRIGWKGLEEVVVTDAHAFVFLNAVAAYVVPRRCCSAEEFAGFVDAVRTGMANSRRAGGEKALLF